MTRRFVPVAFAATVALVGLLVPAAVSAGGPAITFEVEIGSGCVSGTAPAGDIDLTLLDRDGNVIDRDVAFNPGHGSWFSDECFWYDIRPTDVIRAEQGGVTRNLKIPRITVTSNRVTDVVKGIGPTNGTFALETFACTEIWQCSFGPTIPLAPTASGSYSRDVTPQIDLLGGDRLVPTWTSPKGDTVENDATVPYMEVEVLGGSVEGSANPGKEVTVTLRTASGSLIGDGTDRAGSRSGRWEVELETSGGSPAYPMTGRRVQGSFASDASFRIPSMSLDADDDDIFGTCLPNATVYVFLENRGDDPGLPGWTDGTVQSNADGTYSIPIDQTWEPAYDPSSGDRWELSCRTAAGDVVSRYARLP